jgi:thiol-disulfide isomerase/thioredoxin
MESGWLAQNFVPPKAITQVHEAQISKVSSAAGMYPALTRGRILGVLLFFSSVLDFAESGVCLCALCWLQPQPVPQPTQLTGTMKGLRSDEELAALISSSKGGTAVVEFGTTWCVKCHEMFPQFLQLSKKVRTYHRCKCCLLTGNSWRLACASN